MINFQIYKNGQQIEFEKNNAHFNDKNFHKTNHVINHRYYSRAEIIY